MSKLAFVDTETTGLDPDLHQIWEVGLIVREDDGQEHEHRWFLPVDLGRADPVALRIGGFHERWGKWPARDDIAETHGQSTSLHRFAKPFARHTRGAHLVGAVVSFDEERLRRLLKANGACPEWHYHLVDVEGLLAGQFRMEPPWNSEELSKMAGVDPDEFDRHTAVGDARWAMALYDVVMGNIKAEGDGKFSQLKS